MLIRVFTSRYIEESRHFLRSHGAASCALRSFSALHGELSFSELRGLHVHAYVQTRLALGRSSGTINHELAILSSALNYAVRKWGFRLEENPVRYQRLKLGPPRVRYLTKAEASRLLEASLSISVELSEFVRLALNTGCRKNEVLRMRWADIDLDKRLFILRPEVNKTGRWRVLPLNDGALLALKNLRGLCGDSDLVFPCPRGGRLRQLDKHFRMAVEAAGIHDFRIHDLRHTFASWLVSEGVDLLKVRDLLGHSSVKMTERYAHLMPCRLHDAVKTLDMFLT